MAHPADVGDGSDQLYGDPRHRPSPTDGVHASEPAEMGGCNAYAAGYCEILLCASGAHTPAAGRTISRRMMEEGFACVLTTQLKGRTVLRICPIHPETTEDDIRHTIQRMYQYARALKKERVSNFS